MSNDTLTTHLEFTLAELYPNEYSPDSWPALVPRYIAAQLAIYPLRMQDYEREHEQWQRAGELGPEPSPPMYPLAFIEACGYQMRACSLEYDHVASCEQLTRNELEAEREVNQQLLELAKESIAISRSALEELVQLKRQLRSLMQTNQRFSELNRLQKKEINWLRNATRLGDWLN